MLMIVASDEGLHFLPLSLKCSDIAAGILYNGLVQILEQYDKKLRYSNI